MQLRPRQQDYQAPFKIKKNLNLTQLLALVSEQFQSIPDVRRTKSCRYPLHDVMMGALGCMFHQEPSWLQFQQRLQDAHHQNNLFTLFNMTSLPADSQMRDILDSVDSEHYRPLFKALLEALRRDKQLEAYRLPLTPGGLYYVACDGTQYHSSSSIHCEHCLRKEHKSGTTYQHQALQAALMHPDCRQVLPLMPETISNKVGQSKQDCEQEAMKRLLRSLRQSHPRFPFLIGGDSLFAHSPTIRLLGELDMRYLLSCKPGDHKHLMRWLADFPDWPWQQHQDKQERTHRYRWRNDVPLVDRDDSPRVNYLEYELLNRQGVCTYRGGWITDLNVDGRNVELLVRIGRSRWKIENECFNTLKNQGYHLEHNFGHGKTHLAHNMYLSVLLAFYLHQILELCDEAFQKCRQAYGSKRNLWEQIRVLCQHFIIPDWYWLMALLLDKDKEHFILESVEKG